MQQHLPPAVLKPELIWQQPHHYQVQLQQHLPLAVCAEGCETAEEQSDDEVRTSQVPERSEGKTKVMKQQYLPLVVLKLTVLLTIYYCYLQLQQHLPLAVLKLIQVNTISINTLFTLQQHLPPAVCAEGCETAEEQSDDEVRTSQVPEQSEGKTKVIKQQHLPLAVLKLKHRF